MFDTMTTTKIFGGLCGALLIFLLGSWAGETLYHTGGGEAGHGEAHADAYPIEADDHGDAGEEETVDFATVLASADAGKGERVFNKCKSCHSVAAGENGTGPTLFGIVDRVIASEAGFGSYSGTLAGMEGNWTPEALSAFLENPRGFAPGTGMTFNGLSKEGDRANLIAWLQSQN